MKFAQCFEDLLSTKQLSEMTGLEFIQGIRDGKYPAPPISETLNYKLIEAELGKATFSGEPSFSAMNPIGTVHGGWFGTLLDSCMACAVQTHLKKGFGYTTLEYKINIIRPLYANSEAILAIGETIHVGRKTGIATGQMIGAESGKIYATGSTSCLIFPIG
ncbi:MAG: PaaI family thioesterase [Rhodobacteraceae bacterium]|nr:PaaI family thioesterase [Paracoccaceae bacterium]